eukprot:GABV01009129.1.p1 GENE.GABV01009129.1~~GABV01009129.1.p1  ORF type:complete len:104 (-),score=9.18 GABV01009129.1:320-631(-)
MLALSCLIGGVFTLDFGNARGIYSDDPNSTTYAAVDHVAIGFGLIAGLEFVWSSACLAERAVNGPDAPLPNRKLFYFLDLSTITASFTLLLMQAFVGGGFCTF